MDDFFLALRSSDSPSTNAPNNFKKEYSSVPFKVAREYEVSVHTMQVPPMDLPFDIVDSLIKNTTHCARWVMKHGNSSITGWCLTADLTAAMRHDTKSMTRRQMLQLIFQQCYEDIANKLNAALNKDSVTVMVKGQTLRTDPRWGDVLAYGTHRDTASFALLDTLRKELLGDCSRLVANIDLASDPFVQTLQAPQLSGQSAQSYSFAVLRAKWDWILPKLSVPWGSYPDGQQAIFVQTNLTDGPENSTKKILAIGHSNWRGIVSFPNKIFLPVKQSSFTKIEVKLLKEDEKDDLVTFKQSTTPTVIWFHFRPRRSLMTQYSS